MYVVISQLLKTFLSDPLPPPKLFSPVHLAFLLTHFCAIFLSNGFCDKILLETNLLQLSCVIFCAFVYNNNYIVVWYWAVQVIAKFSVVVILQVLCDLCWKASTPPHLFFFSLVLLWDPFLGLVANFDIPF